MELREFVTETLIAIQEGVFEAIKRRQESPMVGAINPAWNPKDGEKVDWKDYEVPVEFDVAVTATDKSGTTGKGGIKVFTVADVGVEGSKSSERNTVSRIKFSIRIVPPLQHADRN
jgi:hypothetical protein